jgi:hypothetical protein
VAVLKALASALRNGGLRITGLQVQESRRAFVAAVLADGVSDEIPSDSRAFMLSRFRDCGWVKVWKAKAVRRP